MFGTLSTREFLALTMLLARDLSAIWTLAMAGVSLASVTSGRLDLRAMAGGLLVWLVALGGHSAPVERSHFFDRGTISFILSLALVLWGLVLTGLLFTLAERRLNR